MQIQDINRNSGRIFHSKFGFPHTEKPWDKLLAVSIDISGRCNLNCEHCSFQKWFGNYGMMPVNTVKKLHRVFSEVNAVFLQGNAEPLLHRDLLEIVHFIKTVNPKIFLGFVTNGTLLNEELAKKLIQLGINKIVISLDGATQPTFETIRRGAKFDAVIKHIQNLLKHRNLLGRKESLEIGIITVASKINFHELFSILALANELRVDSITINGLEPHTAEMAQNILYGFHGNLECQNMFDQLIEQAAKYSMKLELPSLTPRSYTRCILSSCVISWTQEKCILVFLYPMNDRSIILGNKKRIRNYVSVTLIKTIYS